MNFACRNSTVAQDGILLYRRLPICGRSAECHSATQQIINLRYGVRPSRAQQCGIVTLARPCERLSLRRTLLWPGTATLRLVARDCIRLYADLQNPPTVENSSALELS